MNDICNNPKSQRAKRACLQAAVGDASSAALAAPITEAVAMDVSALCGEGTEYRDGQCFPNNTAIVVDHAAAGSSTATLRSEASETSVTLLPVINFGKIRDSTKCRKLVDGDECNANESLIRQLNNGSYCCTKDALIGALDNDRVIFAPSSIAHAINN